MIDIMKFVGGRHRGLIEDTFDSRGRQTDKNSFRRKTVRKKRSKEAKENVTRKLGIYSTRYTVIIVIKTDLDLQEKEEK